MSPSKRNKLLIGIGGAVGLLVVVLLIAPSFFDLNKYKPKLVSEVKKATGRDLVLDGPVTLSLLPTPSVGVSKVRFFNVAGAKNPNMVEVKAITVKPSLLALLVGNVEVSEVTLQEPKIVLEVNAEGKPNWEFAPSVEGAKPAAAKPSSPKPLSLGRLTIENGTLIFSDSRAGLSIVAEKANFSASIGSLDGPYTLAGDATINGAPLKVDLSVGAKGTKGYATSLSLEANGKLGFNGTLSELGPNARLGGVATISTDSLAAFVATLAGMTGQPTPALPPLLAGKFSFDGSIDASQAEFAARDFKMAVADSTSSGSLSVKLKPALVVEAKVVMPKLDLDKVLAGLSSAALAAPAKTAPAPAAAQSTAAKPAAPVAGGTSLLDGITAKVSFDVGEVLYNKASIRNIALDLDARGGVVAVPRLTATLPGDMVLQAKSDLSGDPARPTVSGDFSLVGPKLRETLKWLGIDVSALPANKLTRLSVKGRMASTSGNVQVTNASFELDEVKGTGGLVATFSVPFALATHIEIDTLDIDSFLPRPGDTKPPAGLAKPAPPATAQADVGGPTIGLKLKIAKAIYNKEAIGGIDIDVGLQGSTLKLNQVDVSNLGGARLAARGSVANFSTPTRRPDIAFNFDAPDIDKVMKIAGGTPTGIGKVTASGGVAGTAEQFTLRELTFVAGTDTVKVNGAVSAPGAATGTPTSVGFKGDVSVNGQTVGGTVEVKVAGRPMITADLKSASLDLDRLQSRNAVSARPAPPPHGQAPPGKAIDLSGLRGFDASVKFVAGTLVSTPLRIGNADLAATLKDGVITLQHFKGALYGGTLALSGIVDGSKPALAIDFKGDANNISLGEMLRAMHGSNQFGSAVKVTIDGQLSATGISVKGAGATSEQIKSSMAGGAQIGGHVLVGADKALVALTSGAAGAVGGVIDNTLGNVLGAVGQRGIATNILTAASVVLNRFVNRNNPISGRLDIAGGVLTDKGLAVSGDRATANISTRTSLVASSTDTTLNLMIAEDPSAPYIVASVHGPTSNLSYNVSRGTAKDPPGMVNTLTNAIPGVGGGGQQAPSIIPKLPGLPHLFGR